MCFIYHHVFLTVLDRSLDPAAFFFIASGVKMEQVSNMQSASRRSLCGSSRLPFAILRNLFNDLSPPWRTADSASVLKFQSCIYTLSFTILRGVSLSPTLTFYGFQFCVQLQGGAYAAHFASCASVFSVKLQVVNFPTGLSLNMGFLEIQTQEWLRLKV